MEKEIIGLLAEIKEDESLTSKTTGDTKIIDEIGLDSLEMINFVLRIEEILDIEIDFENFDYDVMTTVKSLCEFLSSIKSAV